MRQSVRLGTLRGVTVGLHGRMPIGEAVSLLANPQRLIVVVDRRRPCGVFTVGDLSRALDIAALGAQPRRSHADSRFVS